MTLTKKKLIPLIRPRQVPVDIFWPVFEESIKEGRLANHGPCYLRAQKLIEKQMTYNCIVSNATLGLELSIRARFKKGSRILIPSFTFKATYLAVVNAGMIPVVCKVDEATWTLDPQSIIDSKCHGAIVVSPFGHTIRFEDYEYLGVPIIYDLAGGWGVNYRGEHIAVYSWHATKNFCVGEGGVVVSSNYQIIREIEQLANFKYTNAKISEIQCAMACAIIENNFVLNSSLVYMKYYDELCGLTGSSILPFINISLLVFSFEKNKIYSVLNNDKFVCKRYYDLIEDTYDCEVFQKTELNHNTRSTIALPRDVTTSEQDKIIEELKSVLIGL